MKKNTKKTTTTRKSQPTKAATPVQAAQPSAFVRGVVDGNNAVQRATGFVAGATNGLVIRPVRGVFSWSARQIDSAMQTTGKACQRTLEGSRRKPVAARGRKS